MALASSGNYSSDDADAGQELAPHELKEGLQKTGAASGVYIWHYDMGQGGHDEKLHSPVFAIDDFEWSLLVFPKGNPNGKTCGLAVYLEAAEFSRQKRAEKKPASFRITLFNQDDPSKSISRDSKHVFVPNDNDWGFANILGLDDFRDPERGFVKDGRAIFRVEVECQHPKAQLRSNQWILDARTATGFVGLKNQGATCYMNSVLQSLYFVGDFRRAVFNIPTEDVTDASKSVPLALQKVFYGLHFEQDAVGTKDLTNSFGWDSLESFTQHDVQELNRVLLDKIETETKGTPVEGCVSQIFEGEYQDVIRCLDVEYKSVKDAKFHDLSLTVKGCKNVYDSLDLFTQKEIMNGENKYRTDDFGLQDAEKFIQFKNLPPVLHLHLQRYDYDPQRWAVVKVSSRFEYPTTLNLDKYVAKDAEHEVPYEYELHAVLVHSGDVSAGHYSVFMRPADETWYKFDDETVEKVPEKEAVDDNFGTDDPGSKGYNPRGPTLHRSFTSAYMLVYVRKDAIPSMVGKPDPDEIPKPLADRFREAMEAEERLVRERREAHLYYRFHVASARTLQNHHAPGLYDRDLIHDQSVFVRVKKTETFSDFVDTVSKMLEIPEGVRIRLWSADWRRRTDPRMEMHPVTAASPDEALQDVVQAIIAGAAPDHTAPPMVLFCEELAGTAEEKSVSSGRLLFFKYYNWEEPKLTTIGTRFCALGQNLLKIAATLTPKLQELPLHVFEEIDMKVHPVDPSKALLDDKFRHGDVFVVQTTPTGTQPLALVSDYYEYLAKRVTVVFRHNGRDKGDISLDLQTDDSFDAILEALAKKLEVDDPYCIELSQPLKYSKARSEPLSHDPSRTLEDLLTGVSHENLLYYKVLPYSQLELKSKQVVHVHWLDKHFRKKDLVLLVLKDCRYQSVLDELLSHPEVKLEGTKTVRLFRVPNQMRVEPIPLAELLYPDSPPVYAQEILPEDVADIDDGSDSSTHDEDGNVDLIIDAEDPTTDSTVPRPSRPGDLRVCCLHSTRAGSGQFFGVPFHVVVAEADTVADVRETIRRKLDLGEEEMKKWRFAVLGGDDSLKPRYLKDDENMAAQLEGDGLLCVEHPNPEDTIAGAEKAVKIYS
eukprot:Rmarinus@m.3877